MMLGALVLLVAIATAGGAVDHAPASQAVRTDASGLCFSAAWSISSAHQHAMSATHASRVSVVRAECMWRVCTNRRLPAMPLVLLSSAPSAAISVLLSSAPSASIGWRQQRRGGGVETRSAATSSGETRKYSDTEKFLLEYVGVEPDRLAHLMDSKPFPNLRDKSLEREIRPCVQFLLQEVGLPRKSLGKAILTCPQLLGVGLVGLQSGLEYLYALGIPRQRVARVVERFPHILKYSVESNLRPSADFLRRELGLTQEQLALLVEKEPACLQLNVERNLLPTCSYLMEQAQMSSDDLGTLVYKNPRLLSMSVRNNLAPKLAWLRQKQVPEDKVASLLLSYPLLFSYSLPKLEQGVEVLQSTLKVPHVQVAAILLKCPQLLGLTPDKLVGNAQYLARTLNLTPEELTLLIIRYPRLLTYSIVENMRPKLQYLCQQMHFDVDDLSEEILEYPLILGYSLEKRIKARHEHLLKCNVDVRPRSHKQARQKSKVSTRGGGGGGGGGESQVTTKSKLTTNKSKTRNSPSSAGAAPARGGGGGGGEGGGGDTETVKRVRMIGLRSMLTPADGVFYARYRVEKSLLHWLAHATINSDPYGVPKEEEDFTIELAHLH